MTDLALRDAPGRTAWPPIVWAVLLTGTVALGLQHQLLPWAADYPKPWILPLAREITAFSKAIIGFITPVTRAISAGLQVPLDLAVGLFAKGFTFGSGDQTIAVPRLSWIGVLAAVTLMGHAFGGRRTALVAFLCFFYLALFGQWDRAMLTLALVVV